MFTLVVRGDNPQAEVGLFDGTKKIAFAQWQAHRELAETLHLKIKELLDQTNKDWSDIQGIVCYQGPGSFTGLRISLSVANALAASLPAVIVASTGDNWLQDGLARLAAGEDQKVVLPEYGAPVHITQQRK